MEEEIEKEIEEERDEPLCKGSDDKLGMVQETEDDK